MWKVKGRRRSSGGCEAGLQSKLVLLCCSSPVEMMVFLRALFYSRRGFRNLKSCTWMLLKEEQKRITKKQESPVSKEGKCKEKMT